MEKTTIQLFVGNRFEELAVGTGLVGEVTSRHWKVAGGPFFHNLGWNGRERNLQCKGGQQVIEVADACR